MEKIKSKADWAAELNIPIADFDLFNGKPVIINTIVRRNLMEDKAYSPYCGNDIAARERGGCNNPRTIWIGSQFKCPRCGWTSQFPDYFINNYKQQHDL